MRGLKYLLVITAAIVAVNLGLSFPVSAQTTSLQTTEGKSQEQLRREAEEARRAIEEFLRAERVLIQRGEVELELDVTYTTDQDDNVRIDDRVTLEESSRSLEFDLIARYGLMDNLELNLSVPFAHEERETNFGFMETEEGDLVLDIQDQEDSGLGDIRVGLKYQAWREQERGLSPDVILDLDFKSRTGDELVGTDHWHISPSITLVKTVDPVVFFGTLGYTWTLENDDRNPADVIFYSLGTGFSLNDRVSISARVSGAVSERDEVDGTEVKGTALDSHSLLFSTTILATRNLFVEPFVGAGLTEDASDFTVGVNFPIRF
jgi:hypothetical protein